MKFFKGSLNYSPSDINQKFHFFVDKDFSYIEVSIVLKTQVIYEVKKILKVLRYVFPGCIILLDDVHVDRYFHDKVFPGKDTKYKVYISFNL